MIRPHGDYVMIERDLRPIKTPTGIYLPKGGYKDLTDSRVWQFGRVIAVGKGMRHKKTGERLPMQSKAGDRVIFRRFDVEKLKGIDVPEVQSSNGKPYVFVRDEDLIGIMEDSTSYDC